MVKTVNAIYTNGFSLKKHYDNRVTETEGKKFNINGLGTTSALNAVKNKVSNVSDLVKKKIMMRKYQALRANIPIHLIMTNLGIIYLMQRWEIKNLLISLLFLN